MALHQIWAAVTEGERSTRTSKAAWNHKGNCKSEGEPRQMQSLDRGAWESKGAIGEVE